MKPAAFDYLRPRSLDEAVDGLAAAGPEAKVLAGGQSLLPMLNFRLLEPTALVDVNRVAGLDRIVESGDMVTLGALVRHRDVECSRLVRRRFPEIASATAYIAHRTIRNRGTVLGSLAHADPAAEWPLLSVLLDAVMVARSSAGERRIEAASFFEGPLETALASDEILTRVELTPGPGRGWAFAEVARRAGDFAVASVAVRLEMDADRCVEARIALGGVAGTPIRAGRAEALLAGEPWDPARAAAAARAARDQSSPSDDLHGSADYRRHVVEVLTRRALVQARERCAGGV